MKAFRRILSVLSAAIWLGAGVAAQAATITGNSTWEGFVLTLPGQPPPPPACTLRDAITAANTNLVINRISGNGIVLDAMSGGVLPDPTPPSIPDPTIPVIPCFARPQEPDCPPGEGSAPPSIPQIGGAGANNLIIGCLIGTDSTG